MSTPKAANKKPGDQASSSQDTTNETSGFKREMLSVLPNVRAFALSLCKNADRADDLVQETVLKAWSKRSSFQPGTSMTAWLFTILRNTFYSQMRKSGREIGDPEGIHTQSMAATPGQDSALDMRDFRRALAQLPDDQREAIILVGAFGLPYEETAEICQCKVGTVKSRVSRARLRLQEILKVSGHADFGPEPQFSSLVGQQAFRA